MSNSTVTINKHEAVYDKEYVRDLETVALGVKTAKPVNRTKSLDEISDVFNSCTVTEDYLLLAEVLQNAYLQAATGKGKERHARGNPFEEQHMQTISKLLDSERGMAFQAIKKLTEGLDLPNPEARKKELLGAINYIAGIVIYYDQQPVKGEGDE